MPHTRLVELSPDAMFVNCDGKFVFANHAAATLFGFSSSDELLGHSVFDFIHPDFHDEVMARIEATLASGKAVPYQEQIYLTREGREVPVLVAAVGFPWKGRPAVEVCAHDMTEQKLVREQAQKERQELEKARRVAENAAQSKSRLVTAVSHDLRQPLQSLSLFISVIDADPNLSPQSRVALDHLQRSVSRMGQLLGTILDLAKLEVGLVSSRKRALALDPLIDELVVEMAPQAEAKGLALKRVPTSAHVESDPTLLLTILRNFVANAIRYTEKGKVLVGVRRRGSDFVIEVYDTGVGIDADKLRLVFEEFYQVGNRSRDATLGLGLGLSIVERMSRILGHRVIVRSNRGKGSAFCIVVPSSSP